MNHGALPPRSPYGAKMLSMTTVPMSSAHNNKEYLKTSYI